MGFRRFGACCFHFMKNSCFFFLGFIFIIMNKRKVLIILVISLLGFVLMIPISIVLFYLCCAIMQVVAWIFGVTYEAANSICFIYLEPAILTFTATIAAAIIVSKLKPKILWIPLAVIYLVPYYVSCFVIWSHYYPLGLDGACRLAYKDLETLGNLTGVGYIAINLFLFIALFLGLMTFNNMIIIKSASKHNLKPNNLRH